MITKLSQRTHIAKKHHICNYCGQRIWIGQKYERTVHVDMGDFWEWKAHASCQQLAEKLDMFDHCNEGVTIDFFQEYVTDAYWRNTGEHTNTRGFQDKLDYVKSCYGLLTKE